MTIPKLSIVTSVLTTGIVRVTVFSATRSVVIPHQIKKLERRVFWLSVLLFGEYIVGAIAVLVGWLLGKI